MLLGEIGDSHLFLQRRRSGTYRNGKKWVTVPNFPKGNGTLTAGGSPGGRGENNNGRAGWGPKHPPFGPSERQRQRPHPRPLSRRERGKRQRRQSRAGCPTHGMFWGCPAIAGLSPSALRQAPFGKLTAHAAGSTRQGLRQGYGGQDGGHPGQKDQ